MVNNQSFERTKVVAKQNGKVQPSVLYIAILARLHCILLQEFSTSELKSLAGNK